MTIDPRTLPDGTAVEYRDERTLDRHDFGLILGGRLRGWVSPDHDQSKSAYGYDCDEFGRATIVRTFSPDPLPSQEVPRDEWANIKPGSRVQAEHADGTVVTGEFLWCDKPERDEIRIGCVSQQRAKVERVFVLDAPADPDADLIAKVARAAYNAWESTKVGGDAFEDIARAALSVVRESEAGA